MDVIIITGAPGVGKTTAVELLHKQLKGPRIDFGVLRQFHLDKEWKRASQEERDMSLKNLIFIVKNYVEFGYRNTIVDDFRPNQVSLLPSAFTDMNFIIFTLTCDPSELRRRISERERGFSRIRLALEWNQDFLNMRLENEYKIDTTNMSPEEVTDEILIRLRTTF